MHTNWLNQMINEWFPEKNWLRVYTDGSLLDKVGCAGAVVFSSLFSHYIAVGQNKSSYDAEVEAIKVAL